MILAEVPAFGQYYMTLHGVYAMSILSTAQTPPVARNKEVSPEFLQQLDCVFKDIPPDAVKIGMVSSGGLIEMIADS